MREAACRRESFLPFCQGDIGDTLESPPVNAILNLLRSFNGTSGGGMNIDLEILMQLQHFRNGIGEIFADFLLRMTFLAETLPVFSIMAVIYWSFNKKLGTFLLMGWSANRLLNGFLKITVCAYRPWIRDDDIEPFGKAKHTATGYSFPSGHSTNAASVYGGAMLWKETPGMLRTLLCIMIILIPFSRLYLGVHTPQDVLGGIGIGLTVMWLTKLLLQKIEDHPKLDWLVLGVGITLAILLAVYAAFKSYPMDYDEKGKLLVDGAKMAKDTFKCVGWSSAFLIGWFLEKRLIGFSTDVPGSIKATRIAWGMFGYYAVALILAPLAKDAIDGKAGTVVLCFLQMFYIVFIFPLLFSLFEKLKSRRSIETNGRTKND